MLHEKMLTLILSFSLSVLLALPAVPAVAQETLDQPTGTPWLADGEPGTFQHEFARRLYHASLPEARDYAQAQIGV
ncbi:MAG: hypothetical protein ACE5FS_15845, partial [Paracoccaceae bacterium]